MNEPSRLARVKAGLALALFGFAIGHFIPTNAEGQRTADPRTLAHATTSTWVPTGNLKTARVNHTATLLPGGKVLVVGGRGDDPYPHELLYSAELYDPTTETWSVTGRLNAAKSGHTATLLPNGQVLVVGLEHIDVYYDKYSAELYNPSTGTWSITDTGTDHWEDHTATLLQTGEVLIAGGGLQYAPYASAALYDPRTGSWSNTGRLTTQRGSGHRATLLRDGRVLVTGGSNDDSLPIGLLSAEFYDPMSGTWSHAPDLNVGRYEYTTTTLLDGKVLAAGGLQSNRTFSFDNNTAELFDPANGHWSNTGSLNAGRGNHTATLLQNGEVLVAGGLIATPLGCCEYAKNTERFDASGAIWRDAGDLNTARVGHTATLLPNGNVLIAGGAGAGGFLNSAELYTQAVSPGSIGPGFTGSWYDPAQSGHGIFVQVLPEQRFYAAWFAFNPAGTQQTWFTGVGTYSGNTAIITAVEQPTGGRWIPNFDPNRIVRNSWGTLAFTFSDCDHGTVDFNSVAGYGAGSMNLTRLTQPAGLSCP